MTLLAEYLARHDMRQAEFSRRTGIPPPMINQYASGERRPGLANALAIEAATDGEIPASYWVDSPSRSDDEPQPAANPEAPEHI